MENAKKSTGICYLIQIRNIMLEWLSFNETGGKNMYDFILKNGNVIDVKNEKIDQADIAVKDGKITGVGHFSGKMK